MKRVTVQSVRVVNIIGTNSKRETWYAWYAGMVVTEIRRLKWGKTEEKVGSEEDMREGRDGMGKGMLEKGGKEGKKGMVRMEGMVRIKVGGGVISLGSQNMAQSSASTVFFSVIWYLLTILTKKSNIFKIPMLAPFDRKIIQNMVKLSKKTQIMEN